MKKYAMLKKGPDFGVKISVQKIWNNKWCYMYTLKHKTQDKENNKKKKFAWYIFLVLWSAFSANMNICQAYLIAKLKATSIVPVGNILQ